MAKLKRPKFKKVKLGKGEEENSMSRSRESLLLQEYTSTVDRTYPDFIRSMGRDPQELGIDKELWRYVEENQPDYDEFMAEYLILSGVYEGDDSAKELAQWMKEVVANQD